MSMERRNLPFPLSLLLLDLFLLYNCNVTLQLQNSSSKGVLSVRLGYFLQQSQPPYRIGAMKLAVEKARNNGLLDGIDAIG